MDLLSCYSKLKQSVSKLKQSASTLIIIPIENGFKYTFRCWPIEKTYNSLPELKHELIELIEEIVKENLKETYKQFLNCEVSIYLCNDSENYELFCEANYNESKLIVRIRGAEKDLYDQIQGVLKIEFKQFSKDNFMYIPEDYFVGDVRKYFKTPNLFNFNMYVSKNGKVFYCDSKTGAIVYVTPSNGAIISHSEYNLQLHIHDNKTTIVSKNLDSDIKYMFARIRTDTTIEIVKELLLQNNADRVITNECKMLWIDSVTNELISRDIKDKNYKFYDVSLKREIAFIDYRIDPKDPLARIAFSDSVMKSKENHFIDHVIYPNKTPDNFPVGEYTDYITGAKILIKEHKIVKEKKYWFYTELPFNFSIILTKYESDNPANICYLVCLAQNLLYTFEKSTVVTSEIVSPFEFIDENTKRKITL